MMIFIIFRYFVKRSTVVFIVLRAFRMGGGRMPDCQIFTIKLTEGYSSWLRFDGEKDAAEVPKTTFRTLGWGY